VPSRTTHSFQARLQIAVAALLCSVLLAFNGHAQVGLPPAITVQPSDQVVPNGGSATFEVRATSLTTLSYKWFRNGVRINGATSSTYTIPSSQPSDAGTYYAEVKNLIGTTISSNAVLTLIAVSNVPLVIHPPSLTTNGATLNVSGPALYNYVVQGSSNGLDWAPVASRFAASGSIAITDGEARSVNFQLYRAMLAPSAIHEQSAASGSAVEIKNDRRGAQSFRRGAGSEYSVTRIVLHLSRENTAPDGTLNVCIGTGINSGPLPGSLAAILPSAVTNASDGNSFQTYEILYRTPVGPLSSGTTYYLNFETGAPNGKRFWLESSAGTVYPRGTYYRDGSNDSKDIWFEIWGQ
jgi:hypothetical protein